MPAYIVTLRKGPIRVQEAMEEYQRRTRAMANRIKLNPLVMVEGLGR